MRCGPGDIYTETSPGQKKGFLFRVRARRISSCGSVVRGVGRKNAAVDMPFDYWLGVWGVFGGGRRRVRGGRISER